MNQRKEILKHFVRQRAYMEDRIEHGIETYRKGWMTLHVKDRDGRPIPGIKVDIVQKNHFFRYGANLFMLGEFDSKDCNLAYEK